MRRVTRVGLVVNLLLSAVKLVGGIMGSSQAVVADAIHSLSDCLTDVVILVGVHYWTKPPDKDHPYGHRRIETLVTVFIGLTLASVAFGLIYGAIQSFREPSDSLPGPMALIAALISVAVKETLYRWTRKRGARIKSSALVANAWHQRTDALSSLPAAVAVVAIMINPELAFLDAVGALLVSLFILHAAWRIIMPGVGQLTDRGASPDEVEKIKRIVLTVGRVKNTHHIRTRSSGYGLQVDLHILVDGALSVRDGHRVAELVKARLIAEVPHIIDVVVHTEPHDDHSGLHSLPPTDIKGD